MAKSDPIIVDSIATRIRESYKKYGGDQGATERGLLWDLLEEVLPQPSLNEVCRVLRIVNRKEAHRSIRLATKAIPLCTSIDQVMKISSFLSKTYHKQLLSKAIELTKDKAELVRVLKRLGII